MKPKWSAAVDAKIAAKWYSLLVLYFIILITCFGYYAAVSSVGELVGSALYRYLIFIPCVFIVMLTADVFEEIFRPESREYFRSFGISSGYILLWRSARLFIGIGILYLPMIWYSCVRLNESLAYFLSIFPSETAMPPAKYSVFLIQCLVSIAFVICLTMFLMFLFSKKSIAVMLAFTYFAFDILVASNYFHPYNIFRGTVDTPDLYHYFPPNVILASVLSVCFMIIMCMGYNISRLTHPKIKAFEKTNS